MLHADLADTSLASEWPDISAACDSLADRLAEALAPFIARDQRPAALAALQRVLAAEASTPDTERETIVVETLRAVYGDTRHAAEIRLIAQSALITISRNGQSYQAVADEFAVTRACPHNHARRIEEATGIKPRRAKSELARQKSVAAATGRHRGQRRRGGTAVATRVFAFFPGIA